MARGRLLLVATGFKVASQAACREFTLGKRKGKKANIVIKQNGKTMDASVPPVFVVVL